MTFTKICNVFSIFLIGLSLIFIPISTNAQIPGMNPADNVDLQIIPNTPGPNTQVQATVVSYLENLDAANITWRVNGVIKKSGRGEKTFSFTTGNTNQTTTVTATIQTTSYTITKTFRTRPAEVDIIWESNGYTPPFYKGKALFAHQNKITFTAFPHITNANGVEISSSNLIYKWIINGDVMQDGSGYGKNSITYSSPLISKQINLRVEVTSATGGSVASSNISLVAQNPLILFYKKDPLYGIEFQKSLTGTQELKESKEISVFGAPYFFEPNSANTTYTWFINGTPVEDSGSNTEIFRQKEGVSGISNISMSVENTKKILQYAKAGFSIKFESDEDNQ